MKKKLLDRRGAAIELAIMMMVFSIFITTIVLTTALLQNEHKTKAQLGIEQDIFLEQLGEDFIAEVLKNHDDPKWYEKWMNGSNGISNYGDDIGEHHWDTEEIIIAATCTVDGKRMRVCKDCGEQEILETFSAPGHDTEGIFCTASENDKKCRTCGESVQGNHSGDWEATDEPSCLSIGTQRFKCALCEIELTRELPALGHSLTVTRTEPTCTENGKEISKCDRCEFEAENTIEAIGHDYRDIVVPPSDTEHGENKCIRCEETTKTHNWPVEEGCCTENKTVQQVCTVPYCEEPREIEIPATGHNFSEGVCLVCGETEPATPEPKVGFSLTVMAADKENYKLHIQTLESVEDALLIGPCGTVVLKITLEWSETDNAYKITEWSKK